MNAPMQITAPMGLLAELTHRCPLACPYCSNPLQLESRSHELTTQEWQRVFSEAAALGVLHIHLSGGEPAARRDLVELVNHCAGLGLYTNLITSGVGVTRTVLDRLVVSGLDHVQLSIQDADESSADLIAGYRGAFARKVEIAEWVTQAGLPLTVNAVIHRRNVTRAAAMVELAIALGARRVEVAHTQYYGWAILNRAQLMPSRADAERAIDEVERLKRVHTGQIVIDHVIPDYHARFPKACMGGWARRTLNITPSGKALPCHAAETLSHLHFWNVKERSIADIWQLSPAFNAYRGTDWMREPCKSCARKEIDFGGCRCQALAIAGDARAADPICHWSPDHDKIHQFLQPADAGAYVYRR
jgi:pyrroloquinoline quinone biosynthesis protein E